MENITDRFLVLCVSFRYRKMEHYMTANAILLQIVRLKILGNV